MKVYIAGPYTKGDIAINVRNATEAANQILQAGHIPFLPHLTHFWHILFPGPYEQWIRLDLEWLSCCDALIRLTGESRGADGEVCEAVRLGIPVYNSVDEFLSKGLK